MRSLATPAFPDDDGAVHPHVREALDDFAHSHRLGGVLEAFGHSRMIVPVVALPPEHDAAGQGADAKGDMAAVLVTGADGRTALLAFSGLETLRAWNHDARPVPVTVTDAARAARSEGAAAIVVDLAGPTRVVIEGDDLQHLADGQLLVRTGHGFAWSTVAG